jgi:ribosomal protein S18 acetylase RimI-like enzyme
VGIIHRVIRLVPMTSAQFDVYLQTAVRDYAAAHLKAGDCEPADALPKAQADYDELLPEGIRTVHQHLFMLRDDALARDIGMLWFAFKQGVEPPKAAYLFDLQIDPDLRGKGYGRAALASFEQLARDMGARKIALNVFGWNLPARALYEKAGYQVTGIGMGKALA